MFPGIRWHIREGVVTCEHLLPPVDRILGYCSVSAFCRSPQAEVACPLNMHSSDMPSWSPASADGDILLVMHASLVQSTQDLWPAVLPQAGERCSHSQLAMGMYGACRALCDGSLWCWGRINLGAPATLLHVDSATPQQLAAGTAIGGHHVHASHAQLNWVHSGYSHTCLVDADGALWCSGTNEFGQVGTGEQSAYEHSTKVGGGVADGRVVTVYAAVRWTVALMSNGSLWSWGQNHRGQLGVGAVSDWAGPSRIDDSGWGEEQPANAVALSTFSFHACLVRASGALWCWGHNDFGQIGVGDFLTRASPARVNAAYWGGSGQAQIVDVACGGGHTCALQSNGSVWCWGASSISHGQVGLAEDSQQPWLPQLVIGAPAGVVALTAGHRHSCVLTTDASVWCWGDTLGATYTGGGQPWSRVPRQVPGDTWRNEAITSVKAGFAFTCAMSLADTVWCWGRGTHGELGNGGSETSETPTRTLLPGLQSVHPATAMPLVQSSVEADRVIAFSVGPSQSCSALLGSGLWCWGSGRTAGGQHPLLDVSQSDSPWTPAHVEVPAWDDAGLAIASLSVSHHACTLMSDGSLWCWGRNHRGQLGTGKVDTSPVYVPQIVRESMWGTGHNKLRVTRIALLVTGVCALVEDGTVRCWGNGAFGALGIGNTGTAFEPLPRQVQATEWGMHPEGVPVVDLSSGEHNGYAILGNGSLLAWGRSAAVPSLLDEWLPVEVQVGPDPSGVNDSASFVMARPVQVEGGGYHACVILTDGSLWCWGFAAGGQIGNNKLSVQLSPDRVLPGIWEGVGANRSVVSASCGTRSTCALLDSGELYCWGDIDMSSLPSFTGVGMPDEPLPKLVPSSLWGGGAVLEVSASWGVVCITVAPSHARQSLWCWGNGGNGRIGTGSTASWDHPVSVSQFNAHHWSCLQPLNAVGPRGGLLFAVAGPAVPLPRLCTEPESDDQGAYQALPPWTRPSQGDTGAGVTSWEAVHAAVSGALPSAAGGWPLAPEVLPPLGVLDHFLKHTRAVVPLDRAVHLAAVRPCQQAPHASPEVWEAHPWLSPCANCRLAQHLHTGHDSAVANWTALVNATGRVPYCGEWQAAVVVLPPARELPLLLHGMHHSVPLSGAQLLLLDTAIGLDFRVLMLQYGGGGATMSQAGGVLMLHLSVTLSPVSAVSVTLQQSKHATPDETLSCDILHVADSLVSCAAPAGKGEWAVHVTVDGHVASDSPPMRYARRRTVCVPGE